MITIAVVNLKGGTAKTTSSVFLAHALHEQGRRVLLVDADPQSSAMRWCELAEEPFPMTMVQLATKTLHKQLRDYSGGDRYDAVVIDTPPLEEQAGIVASALRVASQVIMPMAPTPIEYDRLPDVLAAVEDSADYRADGEKPAFTVLFVKATPRTIAARTWRQRVEADGVRCFQTSVGAQQRYSQAFGDPVMDASASAYGDVVDELLAGAA
jgi:chromosome partitioning protein